MDQTDAPRIRKHLINDQSSMPAEHPCELNIADLALFAYSSEDPNHPLEHLIDGHCGRGGTRWASARPNVTERIVLEFDRPQRISRLVFEVEEDSHERTQEVRVEVSTDRGRTFRQVLAQDYTFSPQGATFQHEVLHGGAVKIESVEGEGSAFTVCIPAGRAHLPPDRIAAERALTSTATRTDAYLSEAQGWVSQAAGASTVEAPERVKPAASGDQTAPAPEPRLRVLLADDNADMRVYVTRLLSERYDVLAVPDGEEAHRAVAQAIRAQDQGRTRILIALTGWGQEADRVRALQAGFDHHIVKPVEISRLRALLAGARVRTG